MKARKVFEAFNVLQGPTTESVLKSHLKIMPDEIPDVNDELVFYKYILDNGDWGKIRIIHSEIKDKKLYFSTSTEIPVDHYYRAKTPTLGRTHTEHYEYIYENGEMIEKETGYKNNSIYLLKIKSVPDFVFAVLRETVDYEWVVERKPFEGFLDEGFNVLKGVEGYKINRWSEKNNVVTVEFENKTEKFFYYDYAWAESAPYPPGPTIAEIYYISENKDLVLIIEGENISGSSDFPEFELIEIKDIMKIEDFKKINEDFNVLKGPKLENIKEIINGILEKAEKKTYKINDVRDFLNDMLLYSDPNDPKIVNYEIENYIPSESLFHREKMKILMDPKLRNSIAKKFGYNKDLFDVSDVKVYAWLIEEGFVNAEGTRWDPPLVYNVIDVNNQRIYFYDSSLWEETLYINRIKGNTYTRWEIETWKMIGIEHEDIIAVVKKYLDKGYEL